MPQLLPILSALIAASPIGATAFGAFLQSSLGWLAIAGSSAIGGALLQLGLSFGISYLASALFRPKSPAPEDVQQSSRNPQSPRFRHYGRVKASGAWVFAETKAGAFHKVLALGTGEIDAIEELYVDNTQVTVDGSNMVQETPWDSATLRIETRLGEATETAYSTLTSEFAQWTVAHRLDGIPSLYAKQFPVKSDDFYTSFPNGINTLFRVVMRAAIVENPVTATWAWSDNAAAVIMDYCRHADGARMPADMFSTPEALAITQASFNEADIDETLAAGGTEKKWRLWGSYSLGERPGDVLGRMLSCCDATLAPTRDGGIGIEIMKWDEPTVIIDDTMITAFSELTRGRDIMTTANVITATYLSPDHDYQSTDAEAWIDEDDVAERGEIAMPVSFIMAPSHRQCRSLMKRTAYRANPAWRGMFETNIAGLRAFGERLVRIRYPLFGIDEVFEVSDFRFKFADGDILVGAVIQVSSLPEEAATLDVADEGEPEPFEVTDGFAAIPDVAGFSVSISRENISGILVPYGDMSWTSDGSDALETEAYFKKTADSDWTQITVASGAIVAKTPPLTDNTSYDFRVRHRTLGGRKGDYSATATINVVADETAPAALTAVSGTGGVGEADLAWTSPNSANYAAVNIRRNTVNTEGSASLIHTEYGPISTADSYTDGGLAAGTYYYWLKPRNGSGVEGSSSATGAVTVT